MKMKIEHYQELEKCINNELALYREETIKEYRETIPYVNNQFVSFCWYIFNGVTGKSDYLRELMNNYFDAHIETAIKKILKNYE